VNETDKMNDGLDDELALLFSALDDVRASDELKAQALDRIYKTPHPRDLPDAFVGSTTFDAHDELPASDAGISDEAVRCGTVSRESITPENTREVREPNDGSFTAVTEPFLVVVGDKALTKGAGGETRQKHVSPRRTRFRAIRAVAVAACLVLALVGGVAYAVPTSTVQLSRGDAAVELGVNRFGFVVSATSADDVGRAIVEKGDLLTRSYDEALERVADAFGEPSSDRPFEAAVSSEDAGQRESIEGRNREFAAERNSGWHVGSASGPVGGNPQGATGGWQPEGQQPPAGAPGNGGQPGGGQPGGDWIETRPEGGELEGNGDAGRSGDGEPEGSGYGNGNGNGNAGRSGNGEPEGGNNAGGPESGEPAGGADAGQPEAGQPEAGQSIENFNEPQAGGQPESGPSNAGQPAERSGGGQPGRLTP